jgi:hypothetical protein
MPGQLTKPEEAASVPIAAVAMGETAVICRTRVLAIERLSALDLDEEREESGHAGKRQDEQGPSHPPSPLKAAYSKGAKL